MASRPPLLVRWLAITVLASVLVAECAEESDVVALNEGVSKWAWVPDGGVSSLAAGDDTPNIAETTYKQLGNVAAQQARKADFALAAQEEGVATEKNGVEESTEVVNSASVELAMVQAAKALDEKAEEAEDKDDAEAGTVEQMSTEDSAEIIDAKEKLEAGQEALKTGNLLLAHSRKKLAKAEPLKTSTAARLVALRAEAIKHTSMASAKAAEKKFELEKEGNLQKMYKEKRKLAADKREIKELKAEAQPNGDKVGEERMEASGFEAKAMEGKEKANSEMQLGLTAAADAQDDAKSAQEDAKDLADSKAEQGKDTATAAAKVESKEEEAADNAKKLEGKKERMARMKIQAKAAEEKAASATKIANIAQVKQVTAASSASKASQLGSKKDAVDKAATKAGAAAQKADAEAIETAAASKQQDQEVVSAKLKEDQSRLAQQSAKTKQQKNAANRKVEEAKSSVRAATEKQANDKQLAQHDKKQAKAADKVADADSKDAAKLANVPTVTAGAAQEAKGKAVAAKLKSKALGGEAKQFDKQMEDLSLKIVATEGQVQEAKAGIAVLKEGAGDTKSKDQLAVDIATKRKDEAEKNEKKDAKQAKKQMAKAKEDNKEASKDQKKAKEAIAAAEKLEAQKESQQEAEAKLKKVQANAETGKEAMNAIKEAETVDREQIKVSAETVEDKKAEDAEVLSQDAQASADKKEEEVEKAQIDRQTKMGEKTTNAAKADELAGEVRVESSSQATIGVQKGTLAVAKQLAVAREGKAGQLRIDAKANAVVLKKSLEQAALDKKKQAEANHAEDQAKTAEGLEKVAVSKAEDRITMIKNAIVVAENIPPPVEVKETEKEEEDVEDAVNTEAKTESDTAGTTKAASDKAVAKKAAVEVKTKQVADLKAKQESASPAAKVALEKEVNKAEEEKSEAKLKASDAKEDKLTAEEGQAKADTKAAVKTAKAVSDAAENVKLSTEVKKKVEVAKLDTSQASEQAAKAVSEAKTATDNVKDAELKKAEATTPEEKAAAQKESSDAEKALAGAEETVRGVNQVVEAGAKEVAEVATKVVAGEKAKIKPDPVPQEELLEAALEKSENQLKSNTELAEKTADVVAEAQVAKAGADDAETAAVKQENEASAKGAKVGVASKIAEKAAERGEAAVRQDKLKIKDMKDSENIRVLEMKNHEQSKESEQADGEEEADTAKARLAEENLQQIEKAAEPVKAALVDAKAKQAALESQKVQAETTKAEVELMLGKEKKKAVELASEVRMTLAAQAKQAAKEDKTKAEMKERIYDKQRAQKKLAKTKAKKIVKELKLKRAETPEGIEEFEEQKVKEKQFLNKITATHEGHEAKEESATVKFLGTQTSLGQERVRLGFHKKAQKINQKNQYASKKMERQFASQLATASGDTPTARDDVRGISSSEKLAKLKVVNLVKQSKLDITKVVNSRKETANLEQSKADLAIAKKRAADVVQDHLVDLTDQQRLVKSMSSEAGYKAHLKLVQIELAARIVKRKAKVQAMQIKVVEVKAKVVPEIALRIANADIAPELQVKAKEKELVVREGIRKGQTAVQENRQKAVNAQQVKLEQVAVLKTKETETVAANEEKDAEKVAAQKQDAKRKATAKRAVTSGTLQKAKVKLQGVEEEEKVEEAKDGAIDGQPCKECVKKELALAKSDAILKQQAIDKGDKKVNAAAKAEVDADIKKTADADAKLQKEENLASTKLENQKQQAEDLKAREIKNAAEAAAKAAPGDKKEKKDDTTEVKAEDKAEVKAEDKAEVKAEDNAEAEVEAVVKADDAKPAAPKDSR